MNDPNVQPPLKAARNLAPTQPPSTVKKSQDTKKRQDREPTLKDYVRVFSYASKWDIVMYIVVAFTSIGAGTALPLMNVIFGQLVGQFVGYFQEPPTLSRSDFERLLDRQALYILGLFLGRFCLCYVNKFCFRMMGIRLSSAIRLHYLQCLFNQSVQVIDSMPAGAAASTVTTTANTLQSGISEKLGVFLEYNGTIWAAIIIAFTWSWDLTLISSSFIIFLLVVMGILFPCTMKGLVGANKAEAEANTVTGEAFSGIRMLSACGAENRIVARYKYWVGETRRKSQTTAPFLAIQLGFLVHNSHAPSHRLILTCVVVRRTLRNIRSCFLVRHETHHLRRHPRSRCHCRRSHVGYDDGYLPRTYYYTAYCRCQSYDGRLRVLYHY